MRNLRIKNILILGTGGILFLLAFVLLGAGQLAFSGILLGLALLHFYLGLKPKRTPKGEVKPGLL